MGAYDFLGGLNEEALARLNDLTVKALNGGPKPIQRTVSGNTGVTTGLGLVGLPLEAPAKLLYPVPTPLRNMVTRRTVGGINFQVRQITGINTDGLWPSVAEGTRNSVSKFSENDVTYTFKSFGKENLLTQEALFGGNSAITGGQNFDPRAFATLACLQDTMLGEELLMLGGNNTALGNVAGLAASATQPAASTGTLATATAHYVRVTALTLRGYLGGATGNGGSDAIGETSAAAATTISTAASGAGSDAIAIDWTAKPGAVAYNVYVYTTSGARYHSTVTTNHAVIKALGSSTNVVNTLDKTATSTDFPGLIYQSSVSSGYFKSLDDAAFTSDSTQNVKEIDDMLKSLWDSKKVSPDVIFANSADAKAIDKIVLGSSAPVARVDLQAGASSITGGISVGGIKNRYFGDKVIPIKVHPNLPPGTIIAPCFNLGEYYPQANIPQNIQMVLSFDYTRQDFAMVQRQEEFGVYASGALVVYAPFACGVIACANNS